MVAVLKDAAEQGVEKYVCVGDVVGYNSNPVECLEIVQNLACAVVRGNHDHYCGHDDDLSGFHPLAADVVDWTRRQLTKEQRQYLRGLDYWAPVDGFTVVHSTLDTPEMWGYVFDPLEAEAN
ncbi:MAG: metallophosphoesterase family protein, partial [Verrucomicrobiota bacterium]